MSTTLYAALDAGGAPFALADNGMGFTTFRLRDDAEGEFREEEVAHPVGALALYVAEEANRLALAAQDPPVLLDEPTAFQRFGIKTLEVDDPPAGEIQTGLTLAVDDDGAISATPVLTALAIDDARAARVAQAETEYAVKIALGFPASSLGDGETLQCRDVVDQTRWLAFQASCAAAVGAGAGATDCPMQVRTTANTNHTVTFAAGLALMTGLTEWASGMLANLWALKDAIAAAADYAAVQAVDITAGWPS